jgi:hypothetical protein
MGLDMYLRIENTEDPEASDDEIAGWRKHGDLNAWFEQLWIKKYRPQQTLRTIRFGDDYFEVSAFNVQKVDLDLKDLQELFDDLIDGNLPQSNGPFHTNGTSNADRLAYDLEAVSKACVEIILGKKVYYTCWW